MNIQNPLRAIVAPSVAIALAFTVSIAGAQQKSRPADAGFSFDVYGDSRSMMFLPYKQDQEAPMCSRRWRREDPGENLIGRRRDWKQVFDFEGRNCEALRVADEP